MADSPNSTTTSKFETRNPKTIEAICRAWRASEARLHLECIEAGNDDDLVAFACDRDTERTDKLFEKLQKMKAVSDDDIYELLHLAELLLEFSWENAEGIKVILRMARNAITDRKVALAA
jgi:hypothetical protein